jgi:hypothetical protein
MSFLLNKKWQIIKNSNIIVPNKKADENLLQWKSKYFKRTSRVLNMIEK